MIQRKCVSNQKIMEAITMDIYNEFELNVDFAVDVEFLCMETLIEEREIYEKEFFTLNPSDIEHIKNQETELFYDLFNPFEIEDHQNQLRDEILIEEQDKYESSIFNDSFSEIDFYDVQISAWDEDEFIEADIPNEDFDFEIEDYQYEEEMFWYLHYLKQDQFEQSKCSCAYLDYLPNDDGFCDYLDCYDYPEGPDENLEGVKLLY